MNTELPNPPTNTLTAFGSELLSKLSHQTKAFFKELTKDDEDRSIWFALLREVNSLNVDISNKIKIGQLSEAKECFASSDQLISKLIEMIGDDPVQREQKLSGIIERARTAWLFYYFLTHGQVAEQSRMQPCNDYEYLGALMAFTQEISKYAIGRACESDIRSIQLCREMINEVNGIMLEFKFRNGPLRRKYDGLKYVVKTLEDILYDASMHSMNNESYLLPPAKRMRIDDQEDKVEERFINTSEIRSIRERLELYDEARENVIKDSRDVQNLSKKAIFSIHADHLNEAKKRLDAAEKSANKIMETITKYPTLRQGSFSNSLEEWAEGKLTLHWKEAKTILTREDLGIVSINEYVGAMSDFTGEIGRLAVVYASARHLDAVREIYQVNLVISSILYELNIGNRFSRKLDAVNTNMKKVGDLIYELTLLQRSGRKPRTGCAGIEANDQSSMIKIPDGSVDEDPV